MTDLVNVIPEASNRKTVEQQYNLMPLNELGLTKDDFKLVEDASKSLQDLGYNTVAEFGKGIAAKTATYTDDLLKQVQNKNLDETGEKLNQVVKVAQSLNMNSVLNKPKNSGFLGSLIGKFKVAKLGFDQQFGDTKQQIDNLVKEIEVSQGGLKQRSELLEKMFTGVQEEYKQLGIYVAAGKIKQAQIQDEISDLTLQAVGDQKITQKIYDLNHLANNLEKRVSDLQILQQSAMQTLPMIRIIQSNNNMLVDKFYSIKNITIPAWKNHISLAISLQEQKQSVELANTIDDATNDLLKRNADLLHQNSVNTAKANQRSVIDIETLEHVQNTLIATVNDVIQIQKEGMQKRDEAAIRIRSLQDGLNNIVRDESLMLAQRNH